MDFSSLTHNQCLSNKFSLQESSHLGRPLTLEQQQILDSLWEDRPENIKEGLILKATSWDGVELQGCFIPYSHYYASRKDPQTFGSFSTVSVTAITSWRHQFLIGKRSHNVNQEKGLFEWVPSGGITKRIKKESGINSREQILEELDEETGINFIQINSIEQIGLFYYPQSRLFEIAYSIELREDVEVLKISEEHEQLFFLTQKKVEELLNYTPELCVCGLKETWEEFKKIKKL